MFVACLLIQLDFQTQLKWQPLYWKTLLRPGEIPWKENTPPGGGQLICLPTRHGHVVSESQLIHVVHFVWSKSLMAEKHGLHTQSAPSSRQ